MRTCLALLVVFTLTAADWPAWRGPDRSGVSKETGLLKAWPKDGPKLLWQSDKAGLGYAGMAVVGGTVYTMGARGSDEYLLAFDDKGQEKWASKIGPTLAWNANSWSLGPNATPTVDGDRVYGLSTKGVLLCANVADGKEVWKLDLVKDLGGEIDDRFGGFEKLGWGYSWSPLVDGDQLALLPGGGKGTFAAVNKKTGELLWQSKDVKHPATYASPIVATFGGVKQYIHVTKKTTVAVAAKDGAKLWEVERDDDSPDLVIPTPIASGDMVYVTFGKGGGSRVYKVAQAGGKFSAEVVWEKGEIDNYHSGVLLADKYLFGFHAERGWMCQEFATGKLMWPARAPRGAPRQGGMVAADGRLYVLTEADSTTDPGKVAMIEMNPKAFKVASEFLLPAVSKQRKSQGQVWTHPSLSDGKLYVRDQEYVFCYQVK